MKAILAAGGTAGHINPAIAIAKEIVGHGGEVLFIGNETGMERELVPKEGFPIKCIRVSGFKRSLSPKNIKVAWQAAKGLGVTKKIIKEYRPDIVIGCGGYVSGPAVFSAAMMKIPTLIHEQNAFPGMTTKILSKVVSKVAISFKDSEKYIPNKEKIIFTGNPVRENILSISYEKAREKLSIDSPFVLVFGGSLCAKKINDTMKQMVRNMDDSVRVLWGTGKREYEQIMEELKDVKLPPTITISPYIYNMDEAMAAADIVVARAGAITLSEICAKGKGAILIPSPYVTHNHQEYNAKALTHQNAAIMILEDELSPGLLKKQLEELLSHPKQLETMQKNALKMGAPDAAKLLYRQAQELVIH